MRFAPSACNCYVLNVTVTFRLRFHTQPGQSLWLTGSYPLPDHPMPMRYVDAENWQVTVPLAAQATNAPLKYSYILRQSDGAQVTDWGQDRALVPASFNATELLVLDAWNNAGFIANAFYTAPFKKVLLAENYTEIKSNALKNTTHTFRVKAPLLAENQTLCLLGEGARFGNWKTESPILLTRTQDEDYFSAQLDLRGQMFPFAYKYGVFDIEKKSFERFEGGANRTLKASTTRNQHTLVNDGFVELPTNTWKGAGVAVPVFSLRSQKSFGVGEFADLKLFADWGKNVGLKLIQLLPINDTSATGTWKDSYPYAAISAFALHPIYLNLAAVANPKNKLLLKKLEPLRQRLNALDAVDYEAVMEAKLDFLKKIFSSQKAATFQAKEYKKFFAENEHWLVPYAAFCYLRDKFGTVDFSQWPEIRNLTQRKLPCLRRITTKLPFTISFSITCICNCAARRRTRISAASW